MGLNSRTVAQLHERFQKSVFAKQGYAIPRFSGIFWYFVTVTAVLSLGQILFEPAGVFGLKAWQLSVFILTQNFAALFILIAVTAVLSSVTGLRRVPDLVLIIFAGLVGTIFLTPIALGLEIWFMPQDLSDGTDPNKAFNIVSLMTEASQVAVPLSVIWFVMNLPVLWQPDRGSGQDALPSTAGLSAKIPPAIGTDIIYMQAQQHYLKVTTALGTAFVLYPLKDAMEDVRALRGIQVHRSYWVALEHIKSLKGARQDACVVMNDGTEIPVSRRRYSDVKALMATAT